MTRKTPDWLRQRREFCEERFSYLSVEFGYRCSLRRFRWNGFQIGYLGPGAGVLVEWYPRDGLTAWLLPMSSGEVPATWGDPSGPRGFDLGFVAAAAGSQLAVGNSDTIGLTEEAITALAAELRSTGRRMLRGDYSQVQAVTELIRSQAERLEAGQRRPPLRAG